MGQKNYHPEIIYFADRFRRSFPSFPERTFGQRGNKCWRAKKAKSAEPKAEFQLRSRARGKAVPLS
jgi:hypothetical protein